MHHKLMLVAMSAGWLFCGATAGVAQVVLSEIMYNPVGSESHDEFIEVVNLSESEPVDLKGWTVTDGEGVDTLKAVTAGLVLQPGQFGLILDPSYFDNSGAYDAIIPASSLVLTIDNTTFGSRGLSNSRAETVSLMNAMGDTVSQYTYTLGNAPGFSDEKIVLSGPNTPENWADSRRVLGTPGGLNSVTPREVDLSISASDLAFLPERPRAGETVVLSAAVHNAGHSAVSDFLVTLFEDVDVDSFPGPQDNIAGVFAFSDPLQPGDSISVSAAYPEISSGVHVFVARVEAPGDQDTTNNVAVRRLDVGFTPGSLVINEIMYAPLDEEPEWVELMNLGSESVDLQRWRLSDANPASAAEVKQSVVLPPAGLLVLAQDSAIVRAFEIDLGSVAVVTPWPSLNNDSDEIVLFDPLGEVIDRVSYRASWGGGRGVSLEKINPDIPGRDSTNWASSAAPEGATPGRPNSVFARVLPSETTLTISPDPFSPDGDGRDDFAVIRYDLPLTTATVNIKIYDMRGRLVRYLVNNGPAGAHNSIVWDGRDDRGAPARMGLYVVFLQALNAQAGVLTTQKKTVVVAGGL